MVKIFNVFLRLGKYNKNCPPGHSRASKSLQRPDLIDRHSSEEIIPESCPEQSYFFSNNVTSVGKKGFTLLELMMVIAILATLTAIAVPNYISFRERAAYAKTIQTMRMMEKELIAYKIDTGSYPQDLDEIGLNLTDHWGNEYQYLNIENPTGPTGNGMRRKKQNQVPINGDFDLYSMGPDGKSVSAITAKHSRDDIVRANNGAFLGRASTY